MPRLLPPLFSTGSHFPSGLTKSRMMIPSSLNLDPLIFAFLLVQVVGGDDSEKVLPTPLSDILREKCDVLDKEGTLLLSRDLWTNYLDKS